MRAVSMAFLTRKDTCAAWVPHKTKWFCFYLELTGLHSEDKRNSDVNWMMMVISLNKQSTSLSYPFQSQWCLCNEAWLQKDKVGNKSLALPGCTDHCTRKWWAFRRQALKEIHSLRLPGLKGSLTKHRNTNWFTEPLFLHSHKHTSGISLLLSAIPKGKTTLPSKERCPLIKDDAQRQHADTPPNMLISEH